MKAITLWCLALISVNLVLAQVQQSATGPQPVPLGSNDNNDDNNPLIGSDDTDEDAADDQNYAFSLTDLDDQEDDGDLEHRRMRHNFCWHQCLAAEQCHRRKADFADDDEQSIDYDDSQNKTHSCPAKVARCDSCILDCKAWHVKCGAHAMHLTVKQVRHGSVDAAVAAICDKCDFKAIMTTCKPRNDEDYESDDESDDDSSLYLWSLFDVEAAADRLASQLILAGIDAGKQLLGVGNDNNNDNQGDEKENFFQSANNNDDQNSGSGDDADDNQVDLSDLSAYNVTVDLDGQWRRRKCEIDVKKMSMKKRRAICAATKCFLDQAKAQGACKKHAVPVLAMYKKALDDILKCQKLDASDAPMTTTEMPDDDY